MDHNRHLRDAPILERAESIYGKTLFLKSWCVTMDSDAVNVRKALLALTCRSFKVRDVVNPRACEGEHQRISSQASLKVNSRSYRKLKKKKSDQFNWTSFLANRFLLPTVILTLTFSVISRKFTVFRLMTCCLAQSFYGWTRNWLQQALSLP